MFPTSNPFKPMLRPSPSGRGRVRQSERHVVTVVAMAVMAFAPVRAAFPQASGGGGHNSPADVQFMQGMIAHHAQALAMVALIPTHTKRPEMQLIAERISISQHDEIKMMQHWLEDHHEAVPVVDANNVVTMPGMQQMAGMQMAGGAMMMPGMLTEEQMAQLKSANGPEFDRLFLQGMIQHHQGALTMVAKLLDTNGAAQAPEVFAFASDVDADQRAEIKRMRTLLDTMPVQSRGQ
jgi:uncharacterized protein (DUF305 family)